MIHKVQVIYDVEIEETDEANPSDIAGKARSLIEQTHYGENCSFVRVLATNKELKMGPYCEVNMRAGILNDFGSPRLTLDCDESRPNDKDHRG
jgi:hypothetical protein